MGGGCWRGSAGVNGCLVKPVGRAELTLCVPTARALRAVLVEMLTLPCRITLAGCTGSLGGAGDR